MQVGRRPVSAKENQTESITGKVCANNMAKEFKLSAERLEELKKELVYLKTVREKEVADQIKEARSFGDLSENSEYDEAKNEQGKLYSRIAEVENILQNCVVIEEHEQDPNAVRLGSGGRPHERPHLRGLPVWTGSAGAGRGRRGLRGSAGRFIKVSDLRDSKVK